MINTLLIAAECSELEGLTRNLSAYCPQVTLKGVAQCPEEAGQLLLRLQPELVFVDLDLADSIIPAVNDPANSSFETILLYDNAQEANEARFPALPKPVAIHELIAAVREAEHWLLWKREMRQSRQLLEQLFCQCPSNQLIGIPSLDGLEFVPAREIIRCEGMQRLTKVFTAEKRTVISAYNVGEFGRILEPYGFFSPHKSHLINLQYLKSYHLDGTIIMCDGASIPVARRRRGLFLERVQHL